MDYTDRTLLTAPAPRSIPKVIMRVVGPRGPSSYYYWVVSHFPIGNVLSGPFGIENAPLPTTSTNFVVLSWDPTLATGYDLLRTTTNQVPPLGSNCALELNVLSTTFIDRGQPLQAYTLTDLTYGAPVDGRMRINNRDYKEPALEFVPAIEVTKIIFPDGSSQSTGNTSGLAPAGPTGPRGPAGPQGGAGPQGATGAAGVQGPRGAAGAAVDYRGSVATSANLPTSGMDPGDAYLAIDTGDLWGWTGTAWVNSGHLPTGPVGPAGPAGVRGPIGNEGAQGAQGPPGATGATGAAGPAGAAGAQGPAGATTAGANFNGVQYNSHSTMLGSRLMIDNEPVQPSFTQPAIYIGRGSPAAIGDQTQARLQLNGGTSFDWMAINLPNSPHSFTCQMGDDDAAKTTTNFWSTYSDRRLKKDLHPYEDGLKQIRQIAPIRYHLNGKLGLPERAGVGIDAKHHKKILPDCVSTVKAKLDGHATDIYTFNAHALLFMLVNSLKELSARLEKLEAARKSR